MIPEKHRQGFRRSLLITCSTLAAPALASAILRGTPSGAFLETLWRLLVYPHAAWTVQGSFPARPAALLTSLSAPGAAVLQWGLLALAVAWFSKGRRLRAQVLISALGVAGTALGVLLLALLAGVSLRLD